jgi:4'-phosphopantetheinyl transferase
MVAHPVDGQQNPVELWFVDLKDSAAALDTLERQTPRLAPEDHKKISNSITEAAAAERRAAYIALRIVIERSWGSAWRGVPFVLEGSGKPALPGLAGSFSLSHVDRYALIGLTRLGSIGVDLEPDRQPTVADVRRIRIESASIVLAHGADLPQPRQTRFLQAWVRLEAIAKADGGGIGRLLTRLGLIGPDPVDGPLFNSREADAIAQRFSVCDVAVSGGCVAAVALDQPFTSPSARIVPRTLPVSAPDIEALMTNASAT